MATVYRILIEAPDRVPQGEVMPALGMHYVEAAAPEDALAEATRIARQGGANDEQIVVGVYTNTRADNPHGALAGRYLIKLEDERE
jgi:hypothetical protein